MMPEPTPNKDAAAIAAEHNRDCDFARKALAFNHLTLSYIARGAPLDQLLDRIASGFSCATPQHMLAIFLFDAQARRMRIGAAPRMAPAFLAEVTALEVDDPDTPGFWRGLSALGAPYGLRLREMLPLRSFAGEVAGVLVVCADGQAAVDDSVERDQGYRDSVGAAVSMAMLAIERSLVPVHVRVKGEPPGMADERMALAIEGSGTGIWDRNAVTGEMYYSRGWKAILGYEDWELSSHLEDAYQRIHPDDLAYVQETVRQHFESRSDSYQVEHRIRCRDGSYKWICSRGKVVARDAQGNALRMIGTTTDITEIKRLTEKLAKSSRMLDYLTHEIPGMVFQFKVPPDGRGYFTYVSEGARETYGLTPQQLLESPAVIKTVIHPEDMPLYEAARQAVLAGASHWILEFRVMPPGQCVRWLRGEARPRRLADGTILWHGFISDISQSKAIELELQEFALTDYLTQLPNRRHFMQRLQEEYNRIQRGIAGTAAVLMCDLDHFKRINDSLGHAVGDQVLKHFAGVLMSQLRKTDAAGRLGGEEFAVILSGVDLQAAAEFATRLQNCFAGQPLWHDGHKVEVTLSIEIALMQADSAGQEQVLRASDDALYRAKERGRNRFEFAPLACVPRG
ncbi:sensor domain-containing diguanylate cyclase [Herbaspirillum frisingense]|uniref:sensor domain-containing diguanylate cyclase n=1 Tax=Herbaspirillum frisingense TaxID=92645 RepID=UPI001F483F5B|nr:sensor domain-containing diguanylate cyclase [Herbaspirillum frisingense]UIN19818.1 diguanylate cyclase [Herbaspirillum frisingense]